MILRDAQTDGFGMTRYNPLQRMGSGLIKYPEKERYAEIKHEGRISHRSMSSIEDDVDEMVSEVEKEKDQDEEPLSKY
jgi:hypothetical protein